MSFAAVLSPEQYQVLKSQIDFYILQIQTGERDDELKDYATKTFKAYLEKLHQSSTPFKSWFYTWMNGHVVRAANHTVAQIWEGYKKKSRALEQKRQARGRAHASHLSPGHSEWYQAEPTPLGYAPAESQTPSNYQPGTGPLGPGHGGVVPSQSGSSDGYYYPATPAPASASVTPGFTPPGGPAAWQSPVPFPPHHTNTPPASGSRSSSFLFEHSVHDVRTGGPPGPGYGPGWPQ
ncbi:hypothetical protein B0H15DRAFT_860424 [Mycena belliarum]|uniref:Uncharacterized protein n=1 Tax=Mycena belliarum TaxID=1033014 RepID=A0AAD6TSX7_9AGAR|nr:hypothetical protein B0H15DRAFT_860424 [Mycena belliae]